MRVNDKGFRFSIVSTHRAWLTTNDAMSILNATELELLENIIEYSGDEFSTSKKLHDLLLNALHTETARLLKWLKTLYDYKSYEPQNFNPLLLAIIWAFKTRRLITEQTQEQFEISRAHLKLLLSSHTIINSQSKARNMFMLVLMLGIRPDLQVRSFKNHFINYLWFDETNEFLSFLFCDRPTLDFLAPYLQYLDQSHFNILLKLIEGAKLVDILPKHLTLSKTENKLLHQLSIILVGVKDHFIERHILAVRVIKIIPTEHLIVLAILECSKIFREQLATFSEDIRFWQNVFRYIARHKDYYKHQNRLTELIDYIEFERYYNGTPMTWSIIGRTQTSLQRTMAHWHMTESSYYKQFINISWEGLKKEPWLHSQKGKHYIIEEITDGQRLFSESKILHHCAFSYIKNCINKSVSLFSLSLLKETEKTPYFTIEIRDHTVMQVAGLCNKPASITIMGVIDNWRKEHHFKSNI